MWVSGRGRPRDLPVDTTPLRGARIDVRARVAWLLRTSRMASPYGGTGREFAARLTLAGHPFNESRVSRAEAARDDISGALVLAYERALRMPSGYLSGVCEALNRSLGTGEHGHAKVWSRTDVVRRLTEIDVAIGAGRVTGGDWLALAQLLDQPGGAMLPRRLQREWNYQLVTEMMRSLGPAYISRYAALARMIGNEDSRHPTADVVREAAFESGAQGKIDALTLLGEVPDPVLVAELTGYLTEQVGAIRHGAARALLQLITTGRLTREQAQTVSVAVLELARAHPGDEGGVDAFMVARRLSLELTRKVVTLLGWNPGAAGDGARIEAPARLASYVCEAEAESGVLGDAMLERLLREGLSNDFEERRHVALMLLTVSPYRDVLADTAVQVAETVHDPVARGAAGHLLTYLAGERQQSSLVKMLERDELDLQRVALGGLAHGAGVPLDIDLHRQLVNPGLSSLAVYAAGMSGHPDVRSSDWPRFATQDVRDSADWWVRHGSAIRETPAEPQRVTPAEQRS